MSLTRISNDSDSRVCWSVAHIIIDGKFSLGRKHFYTELIQTVPGEGDWFFWVYMLGSQQEATEYEFTLVFNTDTHSSNQYQGCCVSVDKDIESVLSKDGSDEAGANTKYLKIKISNLVLMS